MSFDLVPLNALGNDDPRKLSLSSWQWRPLRIFAWMLMPYRVTHAWDFNDGKIVNADTAHTLATLIDSEIASGRALEFAQAYNRICASARGGSPMYPMDVGELQRFAKFCRESGGFTIE